MRGGSETTSRLDNKVIRFLSRTELKNALIEAQIFITSLKYLSHFFLNRYGTLFMGHGAPIKGPSVKGETSNRKGKNKTWCPNKTGREFNLRLSVPKFWEVANQ